MRTEAEERRAARSWGSSLSLLLLLGCSGSTTKGAPQAAGGDTAEMSGGSASAGGNHGATGTATSAGNAGSAGSAGGSGGAPNECKPGSFVCEGHIAVPCERNAPPIPCAMDQVCADGLGCVACKPGEKRCDDDTASSCRDDGSGFDVETCDASQDRVCNPSTGRCGDGPCSLSALGTAYIGCDYFPTVTSNLVTPDYHFGVAVANTTDAAAKVSITRGGASVVDFTVTARSVEVRTLPWVQELKGVVNATQSVQVPGGAYRLRSSQPVTVYQFNPLEYTMGASSYSASNDASLLLPVSSWTGKYWVVARHNWGASATDNYRGFYTVTAAYDGTEVTVRAGPLGPGVLTGVLGVDASGNGTVKLNAGDVFTVFTDGPGTVNDPQDVTGTFVEANKAVQVIGGHQCTNVPDDVKFCDHLEESMFPAQTLATSYFVTAPLIPDGTNVPKAEMVRVVATEDATTLTYDPPLPGAATTIAQAGGWIDIASTAADFRVTADKPISVAQYMEGQTAGGGAGDPAMALAVSESQYRASYLIHAPTAYPTNFLNIIAPTGAALSLDGALITTAQPQAIGNSGYSVIRTALSNGGSGNHVITGSKPIGVTVYGYGQVTSYWYPGGLDLNDLSRPGGVDH